MAARAMNGWFKMRLLVLAATGPIALSMGVVILTHEPYGSPAVPAVEARPHAPPAAAETAPDSRRGPTAPADISRARFRSLLARLSRTRAPARRRALFEQARADLETYEPYLLEVLATGRDPLVLDAIALAGELGVPGALADLRSLVNAFRPEVSAAAIRAAHRISPWPGAELRKMLEFEPAFPEHPLVLEAALQACAGSPDAPTDRVIALLAHQDQRVRTAAVAAVPELGSGEYMEALCRFARDAEGLQARAAARALGRTALPAEAERSLHSLLRRGNWMVVEAALIALASKQGPLLDPGPVLAVVGDHDRSVRERFHGFLAFENSGTVPAAEIAAMLPGLPPALRLLAARCLITAGRRAGVAALIDLLDAPHAAFAAGEREWAVGGARAVLTELAGRSHADSAGWRRWYGELEILEPRRLQTPAPALF